jgi:hypothetical protein
VRSTSYLNSKCFLYVFLIVLKKTCVYHMLRGHVSFLYVDCRKFPTNFLSYLKLFSPLYHIRFFYFLFFKQKTKGMLQNTLSLKIKQNNKKCKSNKKEKEESNFMDIAIEGTMKCTNNIF